MEKGLTTLGNVIIDAVTSGSWAVMLDRARTHI